MTQGLPLVIEPDALQAALGRDDMVIIDLSLTVHPAIIPGSAHLEYARLVDPRPPATGSVPDAAQLGVLFSSLGLSADTRVVAYDDQDSTKACRLLWTLDVVGHNKYSLLNGGLTAWVKEGHPTSGHHSAMISGHFTPCINSGVTADKHYVLSRLHDPGTVIVDCRSPAEYAGHNVIARRSGHIPGAVNVEWSRAIDEHLNKRLVPPDALRAIYEGAGISPDKEIIVYCQSHRRSALTYFALKSLGYARVRAYPGAWSEWGNDLDTPIER